jgi:hypothetical protein
MSRDFSPQDGDGARRGLAASQERSARDTRRTERARTEFEQTPERSQEIAHPEVLFSPDRVVLYDRGWGYRLTESAVRTIAELGRFRMVASYDLAQYAYAGLPGRASVDVNNLIRQGLSQKGTFEGPEATPRELLTLTRRGHSLLRANRLVPENQAVYHGFVKPKDANHDADLYRMYQREARRIEREGGRNLRVVLDYELKGRINRDTSRVGTTARQEIAVRHGLQVVGNKIPVPDLRIEYETPEGGLARVDLELVTEHYGGRCLAEKVRAGFSLYTPHGESDRLRSVLDQYQLRADIESL